MSNSNYELKFDPKTIEHLGVKMYSTLPPALAELISNAYDADASEVLINFHEQNGRPVSIQVIDDGLGMSSSDIQSKFLVIGRNRRAEDGDKPTKRFQRLPTGKKGLGKLALFGLASKITVDTNKNCLRNRFSLDWEKLLSAEGTYNPVSELRDSSNEMKNGTNIRLSGLKRKTPFDLEGLADNLSRLFIVDDTFKIILNHTNGKNIVVSSERRYSQITKEFSWTKDDVVTELATNPFFKDIEFQLITSKFPIPPNSGLRGVTIFSRSKLVNAPEFFSNSTSSHFFQYLTGWIRADFIDLVDEDVISTNRQSINWDNPEMAEFRAFLTLLISEVNASWRTKRKNAKEVKFQQVTGIDKEAWFSKLPQDIKLSAQKIVNTLSTEEGVSESYAPIVEALYEIIPEYPLLHWRHLHSKIQGEVEGYYQNQQYGIAADQGTKVYGEILRDISGKNIDGQKLADLFSVKDGNADIKLSKLETESEINIQAGQMHLTRGIMAGFRNPVNHAPINKIVPNTFSELDCLNVLSLISYLVTRLDNVNPSEDL